MDYDKFREVCLAARLCIPKSFVDITRPALLTVPALSDCPVVDNCVGAHEETLENSGEHINALEAQVASKDAKIVSKVANADGLEQAFEWQKKGRS